jgi:predicted transport protein
MEYEFLEMEKLDENTGLRPVIDKNLNKLEDGLKFVDNEVTNDNGRIDSLALDKNKNVVVVEYKTIEDDLALVQALSYANWVQNHPGDVTSLINRKLNENLDEINDVRIFLVAPSFSEKLKNAVAIIDEPEILLFEANTYKGNKISVNQVTPAQKVITPKSYEIEDHFQRGNAAMRPVFDKLKQELEKFTPQKPEFNAKKFYIGVKRKHLFAVIQVYNARIDVFFKLKSKPENPRISDSTWGSWTNCAVQIRDSREIDDELIKWLKESYEIQGNK